MTGNIKSPPTSGVVPDEGSKPAFEIEAGPRWSIWIDIEGFSILWGKGGLAIAGLRALMSGIFAIGTRAYAGGGERLFAHQFGDGFVIVGDFHEAALDRCAAIAVALMRHVTTAGCLARAAIAEGEFSDYSGCWPKEIRRKIERDQSDDVVGLGSGLMTLLPVMGTALINANKLDSGNKIKGAVLTIRTADAPRVSPSFPRQEVRDAAHLTMIDWVHATSPYIDEIVERARIATVSPDQLRASVRAYIAGQPELSPAWLAGTTQYASLTETDDAAGA